MTYTSTRKNACRIGVEFSGLAEAAEQGPPHVRLAFADPALLDLDAPLQRERPVRGALDFSLGRLAFPLREGFQRGRIEDRRLVIGGLGIRKPAARFRDARIAVLDIGLPALRRRSESSAIAALPRAANDCARRSFPPRWCRHF